MGDLQQDLIDQLGAVADILHELFVSLVSVYFGCSTSWLTWSPDTTQGVAGGSDSARDFELLFADADGTGSSSPSSKASSIV